MSGLQRHMHHHACRNCGHGRCYHDRERAYPDSGPNGSYHYRYRDCPDGSGRFRL